MNSKKPLHPIEKFEAKAKEILALIESELFETTLYELTPVLLQASNLFREAFGTSRRGFEVWTELLTVGDLEDDVVFFSSQNHSTNCDETTTWILNLKRSRHDEKITKKHIATAINRWLESPELRCAIEHHPKYDPAKQAALEYWNSSLIIGWPDVSEFMGTGRNHLEKEASRKEIERYSKATAQPLLNKSR